MNRPNRTRYLCLIATPIILLAVMAQPAGAHDYSTRLGYGYEKRQYFEQRQGGSRTGSVQITDSRTFETSWQISTTFGASAQVVNSSTGFTYGEANSYTQSLALNVDSGRCGYMQTAVRRKYAIVNVYKGKWSWFPPSLPTENGHEYKGTSKITQGRGSLVFHYAYTRPLPAGRSHC